MGLENCSGLLPGMLRGSDLELLQFIQSFDSFMIFKGALISLFAECPTCPT